MLKNHLCVIITARTQQAHAQTWWHLAVTNFKAANTPWAAAGIQKEL